MPEVRTYIAVGPNCYGIANIREVAINNLKKNWPTFIPPNGQFECFSCPDGATVDEHGRIVYKKEDATPPFLVSRGNASMWRTL